MTGYQIWQEIKVDFIQQQLTRIEGPLDIHPDRFYASLV